MAIKTKYKDPQISDFKPDDIVINIAEGTLFYKANNKLFKLIGNDLNLPENERIRNFHASISASNGYFAGGPGIGGLAIEGKGIKKFSIEPPTLEVNGSVFPPITSEPVYNLGSLSRPWKTVFVSDGSFRFVKRNKGIGYSKVGTTFIVGQYRTENLAESTTFTKENVDDLKEGKSLNKDGKISASGDMNIDGNFKVRGSSSFEYSITSSHNISSSGLLYGTGLQGTSLDFTINSGNTFNFIKAPATPAAAIDAEGNITASGAISSSGVITATSHISTSGDFYGNNIGPIYDNYIYLTPADFYGQGNTDTRNPYVMGDNGAYLTDGATLDYHAMAVIPNGYKATHAVVYDNNPAGSTYTTYSSSIGASGGALSAGQAGGSTATNTEADITDIAGGGGVYCVLVWNPGLALNRCYGGRITLAKA